MSDGKSNGSIKVQVLSSFSEKINTITNELVTLEEAIAAADSAVQDAINAAGGEATAVGTAIVNNCQTANSAEFKKTTDSLDAFLQGTKHISAAFVAEQAEILKAINSIEGESAGGSGDGPTAMVA